MFYFVMTAYVFTQAQAPLSLPYFTGFDSPAQKAGWKEYRKGFLSSFKWTNSSMLSHDYNVGGNTTDTVDDWYVSPAFNFKNKGKITFKGRCGGFSNPNGQNLRMYFSSTKADPATGNYQLIANLSYLPKGMDFKDTLVDIPFTADSGFIAFRYITIGAEWWVPNIDSITVSPGNMANVNKQANLKKIELFPNPVKNTLFFKLNGEQPSYRFKLYNLCGKETLNKVIDAQTPSLGIEQTAGTYFYVVEDLGGNFMQRGKLLIE